MNPCIGDRPLDPPEDSDCKVCGGSGVVNFILVSGGRSHGLCPQCDHDEELEDCMPDLSDPGEPNGYHD